MQDSFLNYFYLLIGQREKQKHQCCSTHPHIHSLIPAYALTGDQTLNLRILGQPSNQLGYPARARMQDSKTSSSSEVFNSKI